MSAMQVKSVDLSRLDPFCVLEDHTGEVGGSLHRDIMNHCGQMLQVTYYSSCTGTAWTAVVMCFRWRPTHLEQGQHEPLWSHAPSDVLRILPRDIVNHRGHMLQVTSFLSCTGTSWTTVVTCFRWRPTHPAQWQYEPLWVHAPDKSYSSYIGTALTAVVTCFRLRPTHSAHGQHEPLVNSSDDVLLNLHRDSVNPVLTWSRWCPTQPAQGQHEPLW